MTDDAADAQQLRRIQAQLTRCLHTVEAATTQLQGFRGRVGPLSDDVRRIIGGTAQGTDADMIESLGRTSVLIDRAVASCAQARTAGRRFGGSL